MVANILIDVEVLYYLYRNDPPIHRYAHTYAGGVVAGLVAGLLMFAAGRVASRLLPAGWLWMERLTSTPTRTLVLESLSAGLVGGVSHVLLDSLMHQDMHPFWPFMGGNPLAGVIGIRSLHIGLAIAGLFGAVMWLLLGAMRHR